jgi:hypothetical protein
MKYAYLLTAMSMVFSLNIANAQGGKGAGPAGGQAGGIHSTGTPARTSTPRSPGTETGSGVGSANRAAGPTRKMENAADSTGHAVGGAAKTGEKGVKGAANKVETGVTGHTHK